MLCLVRWWELLLAVWGAVILGILSLWVIMSIENAITRRRKR